METAAAVALNGGARGFLKAPAMTDGFRLRSPGVIFSKVGLKLVSKSQLYSPESTISALRQLVAVNSVKVLWVITCELRGGGAFPHPVLSRNYG